MIINKTDLVEAMENYSTWRNMVQLSHLYHPWFEKDGTMEYIVFFFSSVQVLLNVGVIFVLSYYIKNSRNYENSSKFIINLAVTDLVGFVIMLTVWLIQCSVWCNHSEYRSFDPSTYSLRMREMFQIQNAILIYSYMNTVFATVAMTIDRYLFIAKAIRYKAIMNERKVRMMIGLTWLVPFVFSLITHLNTSEEIEETFCIVTHATKKWANFISALQLLVTIIILYGLYGKIIVKYWKLKRKFAQMKKRNIGDPSVQESQDALHAISTVSKKAQKMMTMLKNSKYAIFVITAFTICWFPWVLLGVYDIDVHQSGSLDEIALGCGKHLSLKLQTNLSCLEYFHGQACVHELMADRLLECDVPGSQVEVCNAIHTHLHDYYVWFLSGVCMTFSLLSSVMNPFIHGIWYPGFRKALMFIKNRFTRARGISTQAYQMNVTGSSSGNSNQNMI